MVHVCLCIYHPDEDRAEVKTCWTNMSDEYLLLIVQFVGSDTV